MIPNDGNLFFHQSAPLSLLAVLQAKIQAQHQSKDDDDQNNDEEAPPLQLSAVLGVLDAYLQVLHAGFRVSLDLCSLFRSPLNRSFLHHNSFRQVLEELIELDKGLFDVLNIVVTRSDRSQDAVGSTSTVGLELLRRNVSTPSLDLLFNALLTAVWKTPSSPQSASAASRTSDSEASGLTILYCLAICSRYL